MFQITTQKTKDFFSWLAILLTPGVLMLVPIVNIFTLPVWILWITIPATIITILGIWSYEFQEFGAMPKSTADWTIIIIFYVIAAFFLTWLTNRKSTVKNQSYRPNQPHHPNDS